MPRRTSIAAVTLLTLMAILAGAALRESVTLDELAHIGAAPQDQRGAAEPAPPPAEARVRAVRSFSRTVPRDRAIGGRPVRRLRREAVQHPAPRAPVAA